ncbi:ABC transporter substrate-binding protein [Nocardioides sp. LMS-CY]|uniref:ABC transporter substrate-binding protein n=1 Tax=Nocardioides sp. (strain LMS-CY) TaxID=2840457 RepID=UPI001C0025E6|nr:ABC transporter substrate-binding protein [Nocardioides sp. LMS-CY]QWF20787.1 ABC transporter substrate-binding protein [Nocardioides sp. LMS-CY]
MFTSRPLIAASAATAAVILLAACSGADGSDEGSKAQDDVRLAFLWEIEGESPVGLSDFQNGADLAIDEINEAGGIDGRQVTYTRVPASPLDPQASTAAFLKATNDEPAAMVGFLASGQTVAAKSALDRAQIPVIGIYEADDAVRFGNQGSEFSWALNGSGQGTSLAAVEFMTEDLGLTSLGLMGTNEAFGLGQIESSEAALDELGATSVGTVTYDPTATDLTQQVLAMKDADGVLNWGYPNPLAVQLKQFVENGLTIPTMTGASGPIVVNAGLATGKAIANFYSALPCNPGGTESAALQDFAAAYQEKYDASATNLAAQAYDAVYVAKKAIEEAGSDAGADVNEALAEISVAPEDGIVCSSGYQADGSHILNHEVNIARFHADGSSETVSTIQVPELPVAGE